MAKKAPDAFRTISEVSDALDTPAHVLRFWESKFSQIKPVKRAGGRRYYRPDDIALLGGIKSVLHDQGMTIKGAQKLLRDKGVKHVAGLGDAIEVTAAPEKVSKPKKTAIPVEKPKVVAAPVPTPVQPKPIGIDAISALKPGALHQRAAEIAPLIARLETVRDRMRAG